MKTSKFFIFGAVCSLIISLFTMSSCAKSSNDQQTKSTVEFWEMYDAATLLPVMEAIDEATAELYDNPLGVMLSGMTEVQGPVVGKAFYNDTAAINAILHSDAAKAVLPDDVRFAWTGYAPPRGSFYHLVAVKVHGDGPLLAEPIMKDAKVEDTPWGLSVAIIPTEEGTAKLKDLYEQYPDKLLLIIEGNVYPIVPICDELIIPGNFADEEEAKALLEIIKQ